MIAAGKSELFLTVIEAHKGIIYKIAYAYCADSEDRKDLVQEIILQLWKAFDQYKPEFKHSTWMYRIALNVAISFHRKLNSRKKITHPFSAAIFQVPDFQTDLSPIENISFLHRFIAELRELDKALMLLYLEEKSYREIAAIIGITETNVATKMGRIKALLKQKFLPLQA